MFPDLKSFFKNFYKIRTAKEVFEWITQRVYSVSNDCFYTHPNRIPSSQIKHNGKFWDYNDKYCAFSKEEVVEYLEERKSVEVNEILSNDMDKIKRLNKQQLKIQKEIQDIENRNSIEWEEFRKKEELLEDIKIFIK